MIVFGERVAQLLGEVYERERVVIAAAARHAEQLEQGHPLRTALLELGRTELQLEQARGAEAEGALH